MITPVRVNRDLCFPGNVAIGDYTPAHATPKRSPPALQLEGLRKARDSYTALADRIRDTALEPGETPAMREKREQDARRVAAAYENSFNTQNAFFQARANRPDRALFRNIARHLPNTGRAAPPAPRARRIVISGAKVLYGRHVVLASLSDEALLSF